MTRRRPALLFALILLAGPATAEKPLVGPPAPKADPVSRPEPERPVDPADTAKALLASRKVATGPAELVAFVRDLTARPDDRERVRAIVPRLGDDSYEARELASKELLALPARTRPIVAAFLDGPDPEISRRVAAHLERVPEVMTDEVLAAALLLIERDPHPEAFAALWQLLPTAAAPEGLVDRLVATLARLHGDKAETRPELRAGLVSPDAGERLWAGMTLALAGDKARPAVRPLWADPDGKVRARVCLACVERGDRGAVLGLIASLSDAPPGPAMLAENFLCRMPSPGQKVPPPFMPEPAARKASRDGWEEFWRTHGDKIDLAKLSGDALRGLTLVSEMDLNAGFSKGRIYEINLEGKVLWELSLASAVTDLQRLPNGRLLVTEWATRTVKEIGRDFATTGKVYWSHQVGNSPILGLRLPNGDTLVGSESQAVVVDVKGTVKHTLDTGGAQVKHGLRTRNGHVVLITGSEIVEYDADFKRVRAFAHGQNFSGWGSVEVLADGNYLVADCVGNRAVELTPQAKEVWRADCPNPRRTQRLPNGDTLIGLVSGKAIIRVGRDGKKIDQYDASGGIYALIRY